MSSSLVKNCKISIYLKRGKCLAANSLLGEQVGNINQSFTVYMPKGRGIIMVNCQAAATLTSKTPRTILPVNKYYLLNPDNYLRDGWRWNWRDMSFPQPLTGDRHLDCPPLVSLTQFELPPPVLWGLQRPHLCLKVMLLSQGKAHPGLQGQPWGHNRGLQVTEWFGSLSRSKKAAAEGKEG